MNLSIAAWVAYGLVAFGVTVAAAELWFLYVLSRRTLPVPEVWPGISLLKPLAGADDELLANLRSHLAIDYPGPWEILLGVRSESDGAYVLAQQLAREHPERVRLVLQEGAPGFNPKVNQLITLTKHARYEVLALTDSNVRVGPGYLREHAGMLIPPKVALSSHLFSGDGEETVGAAFDNMTLMNFCAPNVAIGEVAFKMTQIIGKSLAVKRSVLEEIGGWESVKDLLAEDQRLGKALRKAGYLTAICPTFVSNVQRRQRLSDFWGRQTRWAMIRFRVLIPGVFAEVLLNMPSTTLVAALVAGGPAWSWAVFAGACVASMVNTQLTARILRGRGFALRWLLLVPLHDFAFLLVWLRGATLREVNWRGNRLSVKENTRLEPAPSSP